jgi:predicted GNAT superfamily acetyltransferase
LKTEVEKLRTENKELGTALMIEIRLIRGLDEMIAAVRLQKEVWNFSDAELVPLRMFVVAEKIGGQVIGAFDQGEMVAFAMSLPALRGGRGYLHSHMLAVRQSYRDRGLGRRIKLFQRDDALARGIELIEWTFDPLEIKNSWLNLVRLGAIARRYTVNQYGVTSSPLQGGLPSDRLVAEWWLRSRRVETLLTNGNTPPVPTELTIEVPAAIYAWKADAAMRERAAALQLANRERFLRAFRDGLCCLGYERDAQGNGRFLLGKWNENLSY